MEKLGIATVYTGYNYGSALQAFAIQIVLERIGYEAVILTRSNLLTCGRNIWIGKILHLGIRGLVHPLALAKTLLGYQNGPQHKISKTIKHMFIEFWEKNLNIEKSSWSQLQKFSHDPTITACICGSDQIWNASNLYIDPIFFLRFAPQEKRIAYAPSFGKESIPMYNRCKMKKWINEIPLLSVREQKGAEIIEQLTGKQVPVVLDPTLLLTKDDWATVIQSNPPVNIDKAKPYVLLYFLNEPSAEAENYIHLLSNEGIFMIAVPYLYNSMKRFPSILSVDAGPSEFLWLIEHSSSVCTDSFHGTAFSLNFNVPFLTFRRSYGVASNQSSRILSLLDSVQLQSQYIHCKNQTIHTLLPSDFRHATALLNSEREKSIDFIMQSINFVRK